MDPDAALRSIRECVNDILVEADSPEPNDNEMAMNGETLAETFRGLDEWIQKGGFLPKDWRK